MDYNLSMEEQETVLIFNRAAGVWEASTSIPAHMSRFEKMGWEKTEDLGYEKAYRAPKNGISFRNPQHQKREYTEEEKAALRERLQNRRKKAL